MAGSPTASFRLRADRGPAGGRANAADFTTYGSSSAETHGKKQGFVRAACEKNGLPLIYLNECAGGRIPDIMGAPNRPRAKRRATPAAGPRPRRRGARPHLWRRRFRLHQFRSRRHAQRRVLAVSSQMTTSVAIGEEADPQTRRLAAA
ncbi:MAG: hypothetical protein U1F24_05980 [Alphaproteobacteria bacterium]